MIPSIRQYHLRDVMLRTYIIFVWRDFIYLFFCFFLSLVPISCDIQTDTHTDTHTHMTLLHRIYSKAVFMCPTWR